MGIILLFSAVVLFVRCGENSTNNSDVDILHINPLDAKEFVNLSEIADSIQCIKLQTEADEPIGRIGKVIIKEKYIYVTDYTQGVVFVFDKKGKFVTKLNKMGRGPDEYVRLGKILIDDDEEYIEMFVFNEILTYSNISFKLIERKSFPRLSFNSWKKQDDLYYFAPMNQDNEVNGKNTNSGLLIVDNQKNIKVLFDKNIETNNSYYSLDPESFTTNDKGELFVSFMFDNTFYRLEAGEAYPVFTVDFGKKSIDKSIGMKSTQEQMEYIKKQTGWAGLPSLNINNTNMMSFSYFFKQSAIDVGFFREEDFRFYMKMKENNRSFHAMYMKNDLTNFPNKIYPNRIFFSYCLHDVWYKNYLVDIVTPDSYMNANNLSDEILVDGIGKITAMDNPIVVMIKLKENQ